MGNAMLWRLMSFFGLEKTCRYHQMSKQFKLLFSFGENIININGYLNFSHWKSLLLTVRLFEEFQALIQKLTFQMLGRNYEMGRSQMTKHLNDFHRFSTVSILSTINSNCRTKAGKFNYAHTSTNWINFTDQVSNLYFSARKMCV